MVDAPHTGATHIEQSQSQKEVTANAAFDRISYFMAGTRSYGSVSGDVTPTTITPDFEWQTAVRFVLNGTPGASINFNTPASTSLKKLFVLENNLDDDAVAQVTGGGGASVTVPQGESRLLYSDGADVIEIASAGAITFLDLSDTPGSYSGQAGKGVRVNGAGTALEFGEAASAVGTRPRLKGCRATLSANLTGQDATGGGLAIPFDAEDFDTDSFHDTVTNNTRLTVPSGVTAVRVGGTVETTTGTQTANEGLLLRLFMNGSGAFNQNAQQAVEVSGFGGGLSISSGPIYVTAGDYFELRLFAEADNSVDIDDNHTNFWIEAVEEEGATDFPTGFIAIQPQFKGALANKTGTQSISDVTTTTLSWNQVVYDTSFDPDDGGTPQRFWLGADFTFVDGDVTTGTDNIAETGHGFTTGEGPVRLSNAGGALPTGLSTGTNYWIIRVDDDNFKFAASRADAIAGTAVDITAAAGGGTHTVERETKLVVPAGVTRIRLHAGVEWDGNSNAGQHAISVTKNGSFAVDGRADDKRESGGVGFGMIMQADGPALEVVEGDWFEVAVFINTSDSSATDVVNGAATFFAIEVVEQDNALAFPGVTVERPHIGAIATLSGNETGVNATGGHTISLDGTEYDTGYRGTALFSLSDNGFVIPSGVNRVRVGGVVSITNATDTEFLLVEIEVNGSTFVGRPRNAFRGGTQPTASVESAVIDVDAGDIITLKYTVQADTSTDVVATNTSLWIEVVETQDAAFPPEPAEVYLSTAAWNGGAFPTSVSVFKKVASRRFSLNDDLSGSVGHADSGPNGGAVGIDVQRNGVSIGTISFADSSGAAQTATFVTSGGGQEDFEVGDRLDLVGPANWQSMDDVALNLLAFRT